MRGQLYMPWFGSAWSPLLSTVHFGSYDNLAYLITEFKEKASSA